MPRKRLMYQSGLIETGEILPPSDPVSEVLPSVGVLESLCRKAILIHAGDNGTEVTLMSGDGEIVFSDARIEAVVVAQNALLDELATHYSSFESIPRGAFPPILDQHEADSNNRIVGRMTSKLTFTRRDIPKVGKNVACAEADITFLGRETCERVLDGRIYHLSIGIDEGTNTLHEVSTVIEPAAPGAMVLKKGKKRLAKVASKKVGMFQVVTIEMTKEDLEDISYNDLQGMAEAQALQAKYDTNHCRHEVTKVSGGGEVHKFTFTQPKASRFAAATPSKTTLDKGVAMKKALAAKQARITKLKAAQKALSTCTTKLVATTEKMNLAKAKAGVVKRLSSALSSGKLTPAEFKKLDITKLAALSKDALEHVMDAYDNREAVIKPGQVGSANAINFTDMGNMLEKKQVSRLKSDIRKDLKRLGANLPAEEKQSDSRMKRLAADFDHDGVADKKEMGGAKKLEGEDTQETELVPTVDQGADEGSAMQEQIDQLNTQVARVAGIVQDLLASEQEDSEAVNEEGTIADDTDLEAADENKADAELAAGEDSDEDKNTDSKKPEVKEGDFEEDVEKKKED